METQRFSTFWRELFSWGQRLAYQFGQSVSAFDIYEQVNIDVLVELLVQQSNLYLWQNERNLLASAEKIPAFIGVSYIIAVNQLQIIPMYWDCDHIVGSVAKKSYKNVTLPTTQIKAITTGQSSITWMNHFKWYFQMCLGKVLMNIRQNSKDVPRWGNTWKWNL